MAVRNANIMAARGMAIAQFTGAAAEIQQLLQMQYGRWVLPIRRSTQAES